MICAQPCAARTPANDFQLFAHHLEPVVLAKDMLLVEQGTPIEHASSSQAASAR